MAGALFTGFGVRAAAGVSGFGTLLLLVVGRGVEYERGIQRQNEMEQATREVAAAFAIVQGHAADVVREANALRETLTFEGEARGRDVWSGAPAG